MLIIIASLVLFLIGIGLFCLDWDWEIPGIIIGSIGGVALFISLLLMPLNRMDVRAHIAEFQAIAATAQQAREVGDGLEGAAFRVKIAEANQWLATTQYYRTTIFADFIPAEVDQLEPIK